ncbi:hypothetical protein A6R68_15531, partial [Neotoma lepida]
MQVKGAPTLTQSELMEEGKWERGWKSLYCLMSCRSAHSGTLLQVDVAWNSCEKSIGLEVGSQSLTFSPTKRISYCYPTPVPCWEDMDLFGR